MVKNDVDVLLLQCPPWGAESPPLGIAYLSRYLRKSGFTTEVFDVNRGLYRMASEEDKSLWDFERKDDWSEENSFDKIKEILNDQLTYCTEKIMSTDAPLIGLSVNQNSILFARELAYRIKSHSSRIVIAGGIGCYNKHERARLKIGRFFDAFVIGEGEETLEEVARVVIENEGVIKNIPGVISNSEDEVGFSPRPAIKDLDNIPFPTYEEFNLEDYTAKPKVLSLLANRGCVGRCTFCNDCVYTGPYRFRNPQHVVGEIMYHIKHNNVHDFSFNDLLINGNLRQLNSLCDSIIQENLKIHWVAQAVTRRDMDLKLLTKMREAGCHTLQFGIESGSDKILRMMRKMSTVADAERVLGHAHKIGIRNWVNIIVGYPGEEEQDFKKTINFVRRNRGNIDRVVSLNTCNVVFNSDLMNNKDRYGIILPEKLELIEVNWRTRDGNCDRLRKARANRMNLILQDLDIPVGQTNLFVIPK